MSAYLDTSVLVALFTNDAHNARADNVLRAHSPSVVVSDYAAAEFASAISRRARVKDITTVEARAAFSAFDEWLLQTTVPINTTTANVVSATSLMRRLDLALRTADAINIAIALRVDADLLTFDEQMAACARTLGMNVIAA